MENQNESYSMAWDKQKKIHKVGSRGTHTRIAYAPNPNQTVLTSQIAPRRRKPSPQIVNSELYVYIGGALWF